MCAINAGRISHRDPSLADTKEFLVIAFQKLKDKKPTKTDARKKKHDLF